MKSSKPFKLFVVNKNTNIRTLIDGILKFLFDEGICTKQDILFEVKVILNELIQNAICHGNKNDTIKSVKLNVKIDGDNICIIVEDEGEGYNFRQLLNSIKNDKPINCDVCDLKESGRGMILVTNLSEKIIFNAKGNRIEVIKRLR
ncbi:MAG TPA: ATP-binding protein [Clostridium sp.]|nr:ATP-binding protein [Clostridium sp.]